MDPGLVRRAQTLKVVGEGFHFHVPCSIWSKAWLFTHIQRNESRTTIFHADIFIIVLGTY